MPQYLAYIEWFTPFTRSQKQYDLYKVSRNIRQNQQQASIVPIDQIRRSIHLYPKFGPVVPSDWTKANVLDKASTFYTNPFSDRHMYTILL